MGSLSNCVDSNEFNDLYSSPVKSNSGLNDSFESRASNRILLYVESNEDFKILRERWFSQWSEWITFEAVDKPRDGGGGSAEVCKRVKSDRQNKINS
ncbi:MAG: hypothetical protein HQL94_11325, partial [Magnetococcales bacterium]|nr:hypothetical protein [Magnetococcales bacterium]